MKIVSYYLQGYWLKMTLQLFSNWMLKPFIFSLLRQVEHSYPAYYYRYRLDETFQISLCSLYMAGKLIKYQKSDREIICITLSRLEQTGYRLRLHIALKRGQETEREFAWEVHCRRELGSRRVCAYECEHVQGPWCR